MKSALWSRPQIGTFAYLKYLLGVSLFLGINNTDEIAILHWFQAKDVDPREYWPYVQSQNENFTFTKSFNEFRRSLLGKIVTLFTFFEREIQNLRNHSIIAGKSKSPPISTEFQSGMALFYLLFSMSDEHISWKPCQSEAAIRFIA